MSLPTPTPFKITVSDTLLSFITSRVSTARIPLGFNLPPGQEWAYGPPPTVISDLQKYWAEKYDWRAVEARINGRLKMFTLPVKVLVEGKTEEVDMHFVHHRSERPGAVPLLFQHGWPGSFLEVDKIIDELVSPADPTHQAYHVVAPSLPGFSFSSHPMNPFFTLSHIASVNNTLMHSLGYPKYIAQGGDWGSMVVRIMGIAFPESCVAVHVNFLAAALPIWWRNPIALVMFIFWAVWQGKGKEGKLGRFLWWQKEECGYAEIQGTKPQTISYALTDSPIGMLAWILDKTHCIVDSDFTWEDEDVITWTMLYLISPKGPSSSTAHIYTNPKTSGLHANLSKLESYLLTQRLPSSVSFGASQFPKDVFNIPRFWAEASIAKNVAFWREHEKGGHFPSVERPEVLVEDIREFTGVIGGEKLRIMKDSYLG